jgi:flagellar hook assembly protein FlgD
LSQNYPNPFNPETSIEFNLPINSNVTITVYNLLGQIVRTLVDNDFSSGYHSAIWNGIDETGKGVSSGIYFYKMKANGMNGQEYSNIKKMILLK